MFQKHNLLKPCEGNIVDGPRTVLATVWLQLSDISFESPGEENDFSHHKYLEKCLYSPR